MIGSRKSATATKRSIQRDMEQLRERAWDKAKRKFEAGKVFDAVVAPALNWKRGVSK